MEELAVVVAGQRVSISADGLERYITHHWKTVRHYDLLPEPRTVGPELIRATRSPYMGSRISEEQARWFVERAASAPWSDVPAEAALVDADPLERGGSYDAAVRLYDHFRDGAPRGVGAAKLAKVLHLMRPALVPILDSRLLAIYRTAAAEVATRLGQQRPELRSYRRMYWATVREDLLASQGALSPLRSQLRASDDDLVREAGDRLSDLRLLDMVAWAG